MKITADTNLLLRAVVRDNPGQTAAAQSILAEADLVAVTLTALAEFVWVLERHYRFPAADVALAVRNLAQAGNVVLNRQAVDFGLAMLENGADFADGVIAHDGRMQGGEVFVSFDRRAVSTARAYGIAAQHP